MNLLAHAYLSFGHPEILVGNMISDHVKGKRKFDYAEGIQKGIQLHRAIDAFTDSHPATKEAAQFLKPAVGTYAGAFVDVVYDHFLANDASQFVEMDLQQTANNTYRILKNFEQVLPENFRMMLPYMEAHNWLYNYHTLWGIEKSFAGVAKRAVYLSDSREVFSLFQKHYSPLENCYKTFFPQVKAFARQSFNTLLTI